MNTTRLGGLILIVGGILVLLVAALADVVGLGSTDGIGYWQIAGIVAGAAALGGGLFFLLRRQP